MPAHKGIKLHIISQWELKMHPEFPHPESTQFTFRSPKLDKEAFEGHGHSPATKSNDSKADRLLGRQSSIISVYIPSASGSRFFVRYNVGGAADQCPWFYFKLYMNGRHITSWGTNTRTRPSGQVMRALFEPGAEWDFTEGKHTYKNPGTEYRPFFFSQENGDRGAADDGGLLEIKVFRARGRKRRTPKLDQYKDQSKYGVIMPTRGLVDKPQDTKYYDWHLKDAKDNPFATFKFHYRSWDNLQSLHLIPPDHPRMLESQVPSIARHLLTPSQSMPLLNQSTESPHTPTKYLGKVYTSDQVHDSLRAAYPPLSVSSYSPDERERESWMSRVYNTKPLEASLVVNKDHRDAFIVPTDATVEPDPFCTSAPNATGIGRRIMSMATFAALSIDGAGSTSPHEWLAADYNTRPLPEIPSRTSSVASRTSAPTSRAPSITPSLLSYLDRDQPSPVPIIGTAVAVSIDSDVSEISMVYEADSEEDYNFEDVSALSPPPSRVDSKRQGINSSSPIQPSFSLENVTIRKPRHSPHKVSPLKISPLEIPPRKESIDQSLFNKSYTSTASDDNTGTISLTEGEWMRRTPSPVKETLLGHERLWSPTPEKRERNPLLSPERMAEMLELSVMEDDDSLELEREHRDNPGHEDENVWDIDKGYDGDAVELVALHHHHGQQSISEDDGNGNENGNGNANVLDNYEVHAMNSREMEREGSGIGGYENSMSMSLREGNWI